mmetsp:Transcript_2813/g.6575  ORF Transcript_2813/g.6575 Transcript_2813/m.6575 type:complete len:99 (+) Transcript_2813:100-396(+)
MMHNDQGDLAEIVLYLQGSKTFLLVRATDAKACFLNSLEKRTDVSWYSLACRRVCIPQTRVLHLGNWRISSSLAKIFRSLSSESVQSPKAIPQTLYDV